LLKDYRDWLDTQHATLAASSDSDAKAQAAFITRSLERLDEETSKVAFVEMPRPLVRKVLTAIEMLGQDTTSTRPEFQELRDAIMRAYEEIGENSAL
jgi:Flp pilus assembly CpaE family ATPase